MKRLSRFKFKAVTIDNVLGVIVPPMGDQVDSHYRFVYIPHIGMDIKARIISGKSLIPRGQLSKHNPEEFTFNKSYLNGSAEHSPVGREETYSHTSDAGHFYYNTLSRKGLIFDCPV